MTQRQTTTNCVKPELLFIWFFHLHSNIYLFFVLNYLYIFTSVLKEEKYSPEVFGFCYTMQCQILYHQASLSQIDYRNLGGEYIRVFLAEMAAGVPPINKSREQQEQHGCGIYPNSLNLSSKLEPIIKFTWIVSFCFVLMLWCKENINFSHFPGQRITIP